MKPVGFILLLALLLLGTFSHAAVLAPFTTDGCSKFPDGPPAEPDRWRNCCLEHDKAYWLGGTRAERKEADKALKSCIAKVENRVLADVMWAGVRAGGSPYWPTSFRWGYGWTPSRGYRAVTDAERKMAEGLILQTPASSSEK